MLPRAACAAALSACALPIDAQSCSGEFVVTSGASCPDAEKLVAVQSASAAACCAACAAHGAECLTWIWAGRDGSCKLERACPALKMGPNKTTGTRAAGPATPPPPPPPATPHPPPPPATPPPDPTAPRPHVLMVVMDDLGWGNTQIWNDNGEVHTPTALALSAEGVVLARHYTYKYCSPTRSSILSGRLPLHVNQINHNPEVPGGGVPWQMTLLPAKLRLAGYVSHQLGKWHVGMSTERLLPVNRGFNSSLGYLGGGEDYFTQLCPGTNVEFVDFWNSREPAYGLNGTYSAFTYRDRAKEIISAHPPDSPLFIYLAFQNVHFPLEAPAKYMDMFKNITDFHPFRQAANAQVAAADDALNEVVVALKARDIWANLLLIYLSDNGGPQYQETNYPHRGGKMGDFEGGVRTTAFISGGFVPAQIRGTTAEGYIHSCDWYTTLCSLAGVDASDSATGMPGVDGIDQWDLLSGRNLTSPRVEIPLSLRFKNNKTGWSGALISGRYKLVTGLQHDAARVGAFYPNKTSDPVAVQKISYDCGAGCLFDIIGDPEERFDLASSAEHQALLRGLQDRLVELRGTVFQSDQSGRQTKQGAARQAARLGGYWGPWPDE